MRASICHCDLLEFEWLAIVHTDQSDCCLSRVNVYLSDSMVQVGGVEDVANSFLVLAYSVEFPAGGASGYLMKSHALGVCVLSGCGAVE